MRRVGGIVRGKERRGEGKRERKVEGRKEVVRAWRENQET